MAGSILAGTTVSVTGHASFQALHTGDSAVQRAPVLAAFMHGMNHAYLVASLICFLGMWTSLVRGNRDLQPRKALLPSRPPAEG
jgi:hypothetical protein